MTTLLAEFVPVTSLQAGNMVRYAGTEYQVAEVLPIAVLSGHAVIGYSYTDGMRDERVVMVYANADSLAELIGGE
jgi:hypothetical protein